VYVYACIGRVVKLNGEESAAAACARYRYSIGQISFGPEIVAIKIYELYILHRAKFAAETQRR